MLAVVLKKLTDFFTEAIIETRKAARSKVAASLPWMGVFDGNFEKDSRDVLRTCFVGVVEVFFTPKRQEDGEVACRLNWLWSFQHQLITFKLSLLGSGKMLFHWLQTISTWSRVFCYVRAVKRKARCGVANNLFNRLELIWLTDRLKMSWVDYSVRLTHHDPRVLGLICLVKKRKIRFRILSDFS